MKIKYISNHNKCKYKKIHWWEPLTKRETYYSIQKQKPNPSHKLILGDIPMIQKYQKVEK